MGIRIRIAVIYVAGIVLALAIGYDLGKRRAAQPPSDIVVLQWSPDSQEVQAWKAGELLGEYEKGESITPAEEWEWEPEPAREEKAKDHKMSGSGNNGLQR